jgi:hypothetical protein
MESPNMNTAEILPLPVPAPMAYGRSTASSMNRSARPGIVLVCTKFLLVVYAVEDDAGAGFYSEAHGAK